MHPIEEENTLDVEVRDRFNSASKDSAAASSVPEVVGGHGPWQFRLWFVFLLATCCNSLYLFSIYPLSTPVPCSCSNSSGIPCDETKAVISPPQNCSISECVTEAGWLQSKEVYDHCEYFDDGRNSSQAQIFCSNTNLVIWGKCVYVIGLLLSGMLLRPLTIKLGRRKVSVINGWLLIAFALGIAWVRTKVVFLVLRFFISFWTTNAYLLSVFSLVEFVGEEYRLSYGLTGHISWGLAHFILPFVDWLTPLDWNEFSAYLGTTTILLLVFMWWCIPESVEVYIYDGLWARAQRIIRKAARANGHSTEDVEQFTRSIITSDNQDCTTRETVTASKRNVQQYFELALLFLVGFSASFLYFTSIWLTDWMTIKRRSLVALAGTTEIASSIILLFVTCFISLKYLWSVTTVLASMSLLLMYSKSTYDEAISSTGSYLLVTFFTSAAWTIVLLRTIFQPLTTTASKCSAITTGIGICLGISAAALTDIQKFSSWNPKLLVIYAIPNLTLGAIVAVIPNKYFKFLD